MHLLCNGLLVATAVFELYKIKLFLILAVNQPFNFDKF